MQIITTVFLCLRFIFMCIFFPKSLILPIHQLSEVNQATDFLLSQFPVDFVEVTEDDHSSSNSNSDGTLCQ